MPRYSDKSLRYIFDERSDGRCHLCHKRLEFEAYGKGNSEHGWEVDHSHARATGGSSRLGNLKAACIKCNRSKQAQDVKSFRAQKGFKRAPLSRKRRKKAKEKAVGAGTLIAGALGIVAHAVTLPLLAIGAMAGALHDPNESARTTPRNKRKRRGSNPTRDARK